MPGTVFGTECSDVQSQPGAALLSTKHNGTSRSWQTLDLVFSEIPSESNFIGLVSDPSLSQPKSEQLGLPKESYETDEDIHGAAGDVG